ncbi:hypothetical protein [uncultured Kordia sp.]|uniref:hypothetical protein n=1 Tax=uncultured Kordia sp. TaxID=507699 RepID=UPI00260214DD|nr:hypothetical protein [uncultured Kordia sp.]
MKKNILNIKGASIISKNEQSQINGGISWPISGGGAGCGCDCAGRVTGPFYCQQFFACPQVYTCDDAQEI